tara:strand:+ start:4301 stop:6256 length:1956 start_codon:yes stop_codon:yes gene_type:complete
MKDLHTQEQIDEMRRRLYARGQKPEEVERHSLTDEKVEVASDWEVDTPTRPQTTDLREGVSATDEFSMGKEEEESSEESPRRRRYRSFILIGSLLIFIFVAGLSSLFLYFGGNQISNDNIQISIDGPSLIGGGEALPIQVTITNQNTVIIESATLILKYPVGTRTVGDSPRNLYEERIPINDIAPGEVKNIPVRVAVYGEENAIKNVEATIEYRINGSNGMFYKDASALAFKISSSPLLLRIESIEKVASGQLVDVTMTAVSNASTPLQDILVTAQYPNGFAFENSEPAPVFGQNVWKIDELLPEETVSIKLQGIVSGLTDETFRINFNAGPASPDNQFLVDAALAEAKADFVIERPFIDVQIGINGDFDREAVLPEAYNSPIEVLIENTLDETVYDMVVEVIPKGNALDIDSIISNQGFYDSNRRSIRWEVSNNPNFDRVLPGDSRKLSFTVLPNDVRTTASFELEVNVYARRVAESSAQETLIGTTKASAKYSTHVEIASQVARNVGRFGDSGPIPPKVGVVTTYTLTVAVEAGANDMDNVVVDTGLPLYVNWLNEYDAEGTVTYNSVSKGIQWVIGSIPANERRDFTFQVSIQPSVSQLDTVPALLKTQRVKANDGFTSALLQESYSAVTTELSEELGFDERNGFVVE